MQVSVAGPLLSLCGEQAQSGREAAVRAKTVSLSLLELATCLQRLRPAGSWGPGSWFRDAQARGVVWQGPIASKCKEGGGSQPRRCRTR